MTILVHKARSGVLWNAGFSIFRELIQTVATLILIRLLTPVAYGQFGLVTSVIGFLTIPSAENFIAHILQVRNDEEANYQDHFTAGGVIQLSLCALTNLVAVVFRSIPAYADISLLLHIMSLAFLLDWPSGLRIKMLERAMDWKRLRSLHAFGLVLALVSAVGLAAIGAGVYALLVSGLLKRAPFIYDLLVAQRWRPNWSWSAARYAPVLRFGMMRAISGMIGRGQQLMESGVFVLLAGFASFGLYGRAVGLAQMFCMQFATLLIQSIYPILTRLEPHTDASNRASGLVLRIVVWVVIPVGLLLAYLADTIIEVIFGVKWLEVIPLIPWAMAEGIIAAIVYTTYMLLLANRQQKRCLLSDLWICCGTAGSLLLLSQSITLYLAGLIATQGVALFLTLGWLYRDRSISIRGILSALAWPTIAAACAFFTCVGLWRWAGIEVRHFWGALAYGIVFCGMYVFMLRLLFASALRELVSYFPGGHRLNRLMMLGA